jgi:hypothetical protein
MGWLNLEGIGDKKTLAQDAKIRPIWSTYLESAEKEAREQEAGKTKQWKRMPLAKLIMKKG